MFFWLIQQMSWFEWRIG